MSFLQRVANLGIDAIKESEPFLKQAALSESADPFHRIAYLVMSAESVAQQIKLTGQQPPDKQVMVLDDAIEALKASPLLANKEVTNTVWFEAAARTIVDGIVLALKAVDTPEPPPAPAPAPR